ncbi:MAG: EthD domain-containing protein [Solirubrobacterales bacterium]|nr:EthD domain-containing protein [Solirubrobacterales bacterium]
MIKVVALLKRKPGLTSEEFSAHYFERHAPLFRAVVPDEVAVGIVHYVQNHAVAVGGGRFEPPYDCVTEMGFADRAAMARWKEFYEGPGGEPLRRDEERFMDRDARVVVVTEERVPA